MPATQFCDGSNKYNSSVMWTCTADPPPLKSRATCKGSTLSHQVQHSCLGTALHAATFCIRLQLKIGQVAVRHKPVVQPSHPHTIICISGIDQVEVASHKCVAILKVDSEQVTVQTKGFNNPPHAIIKCT